MFLAIKAKIGGKHFIPGPLRWGALGEPLSGGAVFTNKDEVTEYCQLGCVLR